MAKPFLSSVILALGVEDDVGATVDDVCVNEVADDNGFEDEDENAAELVCKLEDEKRRWLLREELDACKSGTCMELDDPAETADSAELDVAESDRCSKVVTLEQEDWTELFSLELECCSEIVSCGETSVLEESPHDTINARHAETANEIAV